jgi:hypothetical protein
VHPFDSAKNSSFFSGWPRFHRHRLHAAIANSSESLSVGSGNSGGEPKPVPEQLSERVDHVLACLLVGLRPV